jgi:cbb3-type cytochrome oxidase cytochrome c subunit
VLNGVAGRRTKAWIEVQIRNSKRHSPETMMPAYNLSPLTWMGRSTI